MIEHIKMSTGKPSTYSIDCHDVAHVAEFSPYEWSSAIIAIGTSTRVTVGTCKFQEEDADIDGVEYENLRDFHHGTRVSCLAWSPETSLATVPRLIRFCTGGGDKKIRIYTSHLKEDDNIQMIDGHTDYINAVCFDPDKGEHVASVSDDHTCRIWDLDGNQKACLPLGSAGMAVAWHHDESMKMMVAEKNGIIRFYNLLTQQPIMSLDTGHTPLMSADWCHSNPLNVCAIAGSDWLIFDTSRSSRPIEKKQCHTEGGCHIRWCKVYEHLLATAGRSGAMIKVFNFKSNQTPVASSLPISNSISWHYRLPILAVGGDSKVHFWTVEAM